MTDAAPKARRILVVDDDEHTQNLLRDLCETSGYEVSVASDGVETLEKIQEKRPDLVLLDLMMPRKDGFEVLKELRATAELADTPVIILTAMGDMDGKIRGMELGADDFVTKPFRLVELQTRIQSTLAVRDYRSRLAVAEEQLAELRACDPLTGAGTYSQLKASLDAELSRSRRYGRPVAALLFGFDDYQGFRYQLGREACDRFVSQMAEALRGVLRGADRLFRMDIDEFVVLLPETDVAGARIAAERLNQVVQQIPVAGRDGLITCLLRFGGAVFPVDNLRTSEDLLREANRVYRLLREQDRLIF